MVGKMLKRTTRSASGLVGPAGLALLQSPFFELIPLGSLERESAALSPGTLTTLTCSPVKGIDVSLSAAEKMIEAGLVVVPHLAAHMVESHDHLDRIVAWLSRYRVTTAFVIGGDAQDAHGPFTNAGELIDALIERKAPLTRIGIGGYPDGHPAISNEVLAQSLHDKQASLDAAGIQGWISTQMCFDPSKITSWAREIRAAGIDLPIHLGIPGVVDRTKLLTIGAKVGIGASLRFLRKNAAAMGKMATGYDPAVLLAPLEDVLVELNISGLHIFTFNAVAATEAWRQLVINRD
jgi:methylenetetrahydrofolate reductase (NADPH)